MSTGIKAFDGSLLDAEPMSFRGIDIEPYSTRLGASGPPSVRGKPVEELEPVSLRGNMARLASPKGPKLLERTAAYYEWQDSRRRAGLWPYTRAFDAPLEPVSRVYSDDGVCAEGLNFASQDYLSLTTKPTIHEAAIKALREYGPHSAGSPGLTGNTSLSLALEAEIADFLQMEHVVLFPTGWAAGFGTITALVRDSDYVVMDVLAHASLQQGAAAATRNVVRFRHLENESLRRQLRKIRDADSHNGILVVSEGLYSMDSDSPNVTEMQQICHEYDATLFLDTAHDLGALGPGGTGRIGMEGQLGKIDLVMGCFSKTFATNGGFLATRSAAVKQFVKTYGGTHLFSTGLSPIQAGIAREAIRVARSPEGDRLRGALLTVANALRAELGARNIRYLGDPSAITPVLLGTDDVARVATAMLFERGLLTNLVEYPAVPLGASRLRMQAMAGHTPEQAREAARIIDECIQDAKFGLGQK